jgi:hypothetical protein
MNGMRVFALRPAGRRLRIALTVAVVFLAPLVAPLVFTPPLAAQEEGERVVEMRVIVDASASLSRGKAGAVNWLCDTMVDKTLRSGDVFYLVVSGENDEVVFDGILGDAAQKEEIKEKIRVLGDPEGASHAAETLRHVFSDRPPASGHIPVTIVVCGTDANMDSSLLRYSRTENFAYWRAITVAGGLDAEVERALKKALR